MRARMRFIVFNLVLCYAANAVAVAPAGMLTFDATSYQELIAIFVQLKKTYKATIDTLNTMDEISTTIKRAQEGFQFLSNLNLKDAISGLKFDGKKVSNAGMLDKARALRDELERIKGNGLSTAHYLDYQWSKIADIQQLGAIMKATDRNMTLVAKGVNPGEAAVITAQNTSIMAKLYEDIAAAEHQKAIEEAKAEEGEAVAGAAWSNAMSIFIGKD